MEHFSQNLWPKALQGYKLFLCSLLFHLSLVISWCAESKSFDASVIFANSKKIWFLLTQVMMFNSPKDFHVPHIWWSSVCKLVLWWTENITYWVPDLPINDLRKLNVKCTATLFFGCGWKAVICKYPWIVLEPTWYWLAFSVVIPPPKKGRGMG